MRWKNISVVWNRKEVPTGFVTSVDAFSMIDFLGGKDEGRGIWRISDE